MLKNLSVATPKLLCLGGSTAFMSDLPHPIIDISDESQECGYHPRAADRCFWLMTVSDVSRLRSQGSRLRSSSAEMDRGGKAYPGRIMTDAEDLLLADIADGSSSLFFSQRKELV